MRRGAIHWADAEKRRPCVILSPERRNALASDVIVVPFSTSTRAMSWHVRFAKGEAGLPAACFAKCEQVSTIPKSSIHGEPIGEVSAAKLREIDAALMSALGMWPAAGAGWPGEH